MFQAFTILSTLHTLVHLAIITSLWDGLSIIAATDKELPQVTELISGEARILTQAASSRVKCPDPCSMSTATYASLCLYVFCINKSNMSCSPRIHSLLTLFIHSAYVIKLIDGEKNHNNPFAPHVPGHNFIWFEYVSDPLELQCHHFDNGGRLEPFKITGITSAPGDERIPYSLPFFTPGERERSTAFSNVMLASRRLSGMINKTFTLIEISFKWTSKLFPESVSSYGPSGSSGALINSYTKCGAYHMLRVGHSFQNTCLDQFLLFQFRIFNMKSPRHSGAPIDEL